MSGHWKGATAAEAQTNYNMIALFTDFGLQGPYNGPNEGGAARDGPGYPRHRPLC